MAITSSHLLHTISLRRVHNALSPSCKVTTSKPAPPARTVAVTGRRNWLFLLTATTALKAVELPSTAADIPLFGLRKKLSEVEKEAEETLKEGIETAEKEVELAERGIETAEKEVELAVSSSGLAQAGAVVVAEFLGVVVATSVVNGILGPEAQKS